MDSDLKNKPDEIKPIQKPANKIKNFPYNNEKPKKTYYKLVVKVHDELDGAVNYDVSEDIQGLNIASKFITHNTHTIDVELITDDNVLFFIKNNPDTVFFVISIFSTDAEGYNSLNDMSLIETPHIISKKYKMVAPPISNNEAPREPELKEDLDKREKPHSIIVELLPKHGIDNGQVMIENTWASNTAGKVANTLLTNYLRVPLYMQVPNDSPSHLEICIPPMRLNAAVQYLQKHYGIYTNGLFYFHDIDRTWCVDYLDRTNPSCPYKKLIFEVMDDKTPDIEGSGWFWRKNSSDGYTLRTKITPHINNEKGIAGQEIGKNIQGIGYSQNERTFSFSGSGVEDANITRVDYRHLNVTRISDFENWRIQNKQTEKSIVVQCSEFKLNHIRPDKDVRIVMFEDTKFEEEVYQMSQRYFNFVKVKDSSNFFTVRGTFMLVNKY